MFCHCCFTDGCSHLLKSLLTTIDLYQLFSRITAVLPENQALAYQTEHRARFKLKCSHQLCAKLISFLLYLFPFCTHSHIFYIPKSNVKFQFSQFSHLVISNSLRTHGLQHTFLSITNSQSLLKFMSIKSVMPSNHLILCHVTPPALNLSQHQGLFQ